MNTPVAAILRKTKAIILFARPAVPRVHAAVESWLVERLDTQVVTVLPQHGEFGESVTAAAEHAVLHALEGIETAEREKVHPL